MGEKPTEADEADERTIVKSKSNITNNREEEAATPTTEPPVTEAARSAGAPLKGVDVR